MGRHGTFPIMFLFFTILAFLFVVVLMQSAAPVLDANETPELAAAQNATGTLLQPVTLGWWGLAVVVIGVAVLGVGGLFLSIFKGRRRR
ncbi:MAG: hypothetical protein WC145_13600 [Aliarcobacter sp.]|jgi:hypothetical protein